ncbi:MAG TPA: hypothetical protein VNH19_18915 [Candidatus Limnocylindrales bacterium]|nr:hypothetical protein [Candidatus Limnocylindrales bacterium]
MSHTPGPSTLSPAGRYVRYEGIRGPNICDLDVFGGTEQEARANARLIAAAPDLLAALQAVVRVADRKTDEFDAARAAIAKATGG